MTSKTFSSKKLYPFYPPCKAIVSFLLNLNNFPQRSGSKQHLLSLLGITACAPPK